MKTPATMKTFEEPKVLGDRVNLFIIDNDLQYSQSLKGSLEKELYNQVNVKVFPTGESALEEIKKMEEKPHVVLLDYLTNKIYHQKSGKYIVNSIAKICPNTSIIIISEKNDEKEALKTLEYGAHDCIVKDKFAFIHVITSVKKALHPPKQ
jgi:DNA-binding NtrC family response regulator